MLSGNAAPGLKTGYGLFHLGPMPALQFAPTSLTQLQSAQEAALFQRALVVLLLWKNQHCHQALAPKGPQRPTG